MRKVDSDDPIFRLARRPQLRLGIMGGTFDPIHVAHLVTAQEALEQFTLDEILFMPTGSPPHKKECLAPAEQRYLMVSLATASHPRFWVSRYEIDRTGVTYTVDTLTFLSDTLQADARLFFITGADAVLDILGWKQPARVLELCTLIAATRPGYDLSRLAGFLEELGTDKTVEILEIPALAISSSLIRERLAAGRSARYLVPEPVAELIEKSGIYRHERS